MRPPQVQLLRETLSCTCHLASRSFQTFDNASLRLARCEAAFQVLKAIAFLSLLKVSPLLDEVLESEPLFRVPAGTQGTLPLLHSRLHLWLASRRATIQIGHSLRLSSCSLKSRSSRRSSGGGGSTVRISRPGPVLLIHAADKDGIGKICVASHFNVK